MKFNYVDIENYCNELHAVANKINDIFYGVKDAGRKLSSGESWEGNASEFYLRQLNDLTKNFDELNSEIENSILYLAKCSDGYNAIDNKVLKEICNNLNIMEPNLNTSNIFR